MCSYRMNVSAQVETSNHEIRISRASRAAFENLNRMCATVKRPSIFSKGMHRSVRVQMPGKKYRSIKRPKQYEGLKREGYSKERAARISNAAAKKAAAKAKQRKKK